ncbi:hypothetical protein O0L34_g5888 [Tuta absoluta]|nr:hypothetical protein O0L34_g5888 [Tuta absoluta]
MEYYSDLMVPSDHLLTDHYSAEYTPQYIVPSHDAEYSIRSSVLVDGGDRFGVSAVEFDKFEELVWMGNQGGHVTSYYGPTMQKYTSFQVHESEEVRDIITMEQGIFVLTKTTLRHQIRRGLPKYTYRSDHMTDMQCLYQVSKTKLLMGGHQDKLLDLDLNKMVETVIPIQEEGCAVLRSGGGSLVACGSASGKVALRDIRSPNTAEHTFSAHTACLSDLDMQGDLLITCGFQSVNGVAVAEPYVVVWDVRALRGHKLQPEGAWSIPTAAPPLLLHFLPAFSGRAVALSGDGHVSLLHVNANQHDHSVFQVDTSNSLCSVMDVAATSQALVFGDQAGHLHLFSPQHNHEPVFNNFSSATEFAEPPLGIPFVSMSDTTFQFSTVPLPPLATGNRWFNQLPADFFKKLYRRPKPIDPEVLKTMKMQGPIGYAPNPRTCKRNQMPYVEETFEDLIAQKQSENKYITQPVPKHYQKMDIRYNKHSPNEVDLESINKTGFPGLEATIPNSYCNSMLQVLYYTAPVKATLLAHTCAKEFCLSCELGFLFRMLDTSGGAPCQASNFLRAFRTVPEAAALGLILPDRGPDVRVDFVALIQSWNRFILHQIHYEILETRKKEKELALLTNSSPPKTARSGNVALPSIPISKRCVPLPPIPMVNGQYEEYQFTELEFLGPATEFNGVEEDGWHGNAVQEDGSGEVEHAAPTDNHELNNHQADREESEISQLFAIGRHQLNRCLKCNKEEERESVVLACALQYPMGGSRDGSEPRGGFLELVRASLAARRSTPAWCEQCNRFTPTTQRGRIVRLPPILAINCGGVTAHEKAYWAKGSQKDASEAHKRGSSGKPCRYGLHCARPGCRFKHPDRPSTPGSSSRSPTHESHCTLPLQLHIRLQSDGDVVINDKNDQSPTESPKAEPNKNKKKPVTTQSAEEYNLCACVVCVEDNPKNLIAYIQTDSGGEPCWYIFNDMSIMPVSAEEQPTGRRRLIARARVWARSERRCEPIRHERSLPSAKRRTLLPTIIPLAQVTFS